MRDMSHNVIDLHHVLNLWDTIEVNGEIMRLIKSKYPEGRRLQWDTMEARYYKHLKAETEKARQYLEATVDPELEPV